MGRIAGKRIEIIYQERVWKPWEGSRAFGAVPHPLKGGARSRLEEREGFHIPVTWTWQHVS